LKKFKSSKVFIDIPVVILTSSSTNRDVQVAYESNANAYVTKPSELDSFFKLIAGIYNFWLK
jgi:CheY-like chemotaxis protein